jgi:hypothetical protein
MYFSIQITFRIDPYLFAVYGVCVTINEGWKIILAKACVCRSLATSTSRSSAAVPKLICHITPYKFWGRVIAGRFFRIGCKKDFKQAIFFLMAPYIL